MKIVIDAGCNILAKDLQKYNIEVIKLPVIFNNVTYKDLPAMEFYEMLADSKLYPSTAAPSPKDFADKYRKLAKTDPDILSIHLSGTLSATLDSAKLGATLVPEANVTFIDSLALSLPYSWQVLLAAKAVEKGVSVEKIAKILTKLNEHVKTMFTLDEMRYLIHGGRVSHLKGTLASVLNIKPIIGLDTNAGTLETLGQARTMKKALISIVDQIEAIFGDKKKLQVQFMYGESLKTVELLKETIQKRLNVEFLPTLPIATALGAHAGPTMVGVTVGEIDYMDRLLVDAVA